MNFKLTASKRDGAAGHLNRVRAEGGLPAVVYGHRKDTEPVLLNGHEFRRVFARAGRSHLVDLVVDGGRAEKVLIREVQINPRRLGAVHVDLFRIDLREKLQIDVPVSVTGESPAVKRGEGDILLGLHSIKVECLPGNIPEAIEVDVSGLDEVDAGIRVEDLTPPEGVVFLTGADELVVKVQGHRAEEEPVEAEAAEAAPEDGEAVGADGEAAEAKE